MRQKTELEITLHSVATGEARSASMEGTEARTADIQVESQVAHGPLMEVIVEGDNLRRALVGATEEGTPQGGPLSPLLSNLMLDVLDKELETRGLNFVRYADDCNIYVRSQRAGERVMASIERFLSKR